MTAHPSPREGLRASDADRDTVAARLSTALSEGRLDLAEYNLRLDAAMSAKTMGELVPLTTDLPAASSSASAPDPTAPVDLAEVGAGKAPSKWREWINEWRYWLGGAVIMIGIWAVTSVSNGEPQDFWPLIPLGIWAAVLIAGLFFPDDDDDDDDD
ncbi:DUF1707 domain-containing protein [Nocardiopsis mangrovi]|uniref:DUF1707 domain-containing protein n=1 Tax=Nocardiopsis mangrovi TaxID=1179818 RepID=A0ABV9DSX4_9ACTN